MNIIEHRRFRKMFRKLPILVQKQTIRRIRVLAENPQHPLLYVHPLHGEYKGCLSFNVTGDVRCIFKLSEDMLTLLAIGTHSELYE